MKCSIDGCDLPNYRRIWCCAHYTRWFRHGDPLAGRTRQGEPYRYIQEVVIPFSEDKCLLWPYARSDDGYGRIKIDNHQQMVTRLICETIYGPPPSSAYEAAHSCGNGHEGCCNPRHLSWKTGVENSADKLSHGTHNRGIRHNMAKLSEEDVRQIRALAGAMSMAEIGRMFGVSDSTIDRVQNRKGWTHV